MDNYSNWQLQCEKRWPGCTDDHAAAVKADTADAPDADRAAGAGFLAFAMPMAPAAPAGTPSAEPESPTESWRGYFLFRTHCERVIQLLSSQFEQEMIKRISSTFPSVESVMRLAVFFVEHMSELWNTIDTNVPSNLGLGNAQRTAAEAFNDHSSFWGASIQFFVDLLSRADKLPDPGMAASTAEAFFSQALFSGGRAKPHVRWVVANALVQWKDMLIPRVFGARPAHYALLGAVIQCLARARRLDEAATIREAVSQFLLSAMRSNPELFYTVSGAASKIFKELIGSTSVASPEGSNALYTLKLTILKSFEHYISTMPAEMIDSNAECDLSTEQLLLMVQICSTTPFHPETTKKDYQRCIRILLNSRDVEAIQLSIGIMVEHICLEQSPESKTSIAELVGFICTETAAILRSPINANCSMNRILPAVMAGLRYFFVQTQEIPTIIFPNIVECKQFTEEFVGFVISFLGEQAVANNQHGCPNVDIYGFEHRARAFITLCSILDLNIVHKTSAWFQFGAVVAEATLAFLLNALTHQRDLADDSAIVTAIEMIECLDEGPLSPVASKLVETTAQLLSTPRFFSATSISIAYLLSYEKIARSISSDVRRSIFSTLWTARPIWLNGDKSLCTPVLASLVKCTENDESTASIVPEEFLAQLAAQTELLSAGWSAQVIPLILGCILSRPEASYQVLTQDSNHKLARLLFCTAPTLQQDDGSSNEESAKALIALCQAGPTDVILEILQREWASDSSSSSPQIESVSNFKEADFMHQMLQPLSAEDYSDNENEAEFAVRSPTQPQIKAWLQAASKQLPDRSKLRMLLQSLIPL